MMRRGTIARILAIEERLGEDASQDNADAKWLLARLKELRQAAAAAVSEWHTFGYNSEKLMARMDELDKLATD